MKDHATDLNPRTDPPLDFVDRDFGELTPADYDALGFMCGLEVHQQLLTDGKLFCRCPAGLRSRKVDAEVLRHMRPTLSELGEYDGTALMEFKTKKEIVYQLARRSVCTYEMDDTPPFAIDEQAVKIAMEVAQLLGSNLVSELHVMRKQYLDGSIPTGFQRTAMVALAGAIPFAESELGPGRMLRIRQLSLEEDSCREISDIGHRILFRTDRLGTPLTETVTEPDLLTPLDVQAGARLLARVARASGKVRRGAGAARQDVNVSIAGGRRVEIKGVGNHRKLPELVHIEAFRQLNLLPIREELRRRGVTADMLSPDLSIDATGILKKSDFAPIQEALERGDSVRAVKLPGFGGLLTHRTQPGMVFARELGERVRVIACLTARPFMIHSDIEDYGVIGTHWQQLRKGLKAGSRSADAVVVLWGDDADVLTGVKEVVLRAQEALIGVPSETRQAFSDGTNGFERILPGPDRMYPDTDTPPVSIPDAWVTEIAAGLKERPWERQVRYVELGLTHANAWALTDAVWADLFDELAPATPDAARRLATGLQKRVAQQRSMPGFKLPTADRLAPLVRALERSGPIRHAFESMLLSQLRNPNQSAEDLLFVYGDTAGADADMRTSIQRTVATKLEVRTRDPEAIMRWAMGRVMPSLLGRIEPLVVYDRLARALGLVAEEATP